MAQQTVKLMFVNESTDRNNSNVVFFQKNVATSFDGYTHAWKVIRDCGRGCKHPFEYSLDFELTAQDTEGNILNPVQTCPGKVYKAELGPSGHIISSAVGEVSADAKDAELKNDFPVGAISAQAVRDGKVVATQRCVSPGEKAVFQFQPKLYVGIMANVQEGDVMKAATITQNNTCLNLLGVRSAVIRMTGGGDTPFNFELTDIK